MAYGISAKEPYTNQETISTFPPFNLFADITPSLGTHTVNIGVWVGSIRYTWSNHEDVGADDIYLSSITFNQAAGTVTYTATEFHASWHGLVDGARLLIWVERS